MSKKHRMKARAVPNSQEWGYASTGTEQVGIRVMILDGQWEGQSVSWYGFLTENAEVRTLEQLEIAGWDKSSVIDLPGLGSTEFELEIEEDTDPETGAPYYRPTWINRIGVAMKKKMDDNAKRALVARLAALTGARPAPAQQRQPAQQRPPANRPAPSPSGNGGTRLPAQYAEGMPFDPNEPMPSDVDF